MCFDTDGGGHVLVGENSCPFGLGGDDALHRFPPGNAIMELKCPKACWCVFRHLECLFGFLGGVCLGLFRLSTKIS
jgi:hypothetical protein